MSRLQKLPVPFVGLATALITPFRNGIIDVRALARLIAFQLANKVDAIVVAGSTGLAAMLSHEEHERLIRLVVEMVNGLVPVIAGTGSNYTVEAIRLTLAAQAAGANGALLISPYYVRPTPLGIALHYEAVADAVPNFPLIIYNIPGRTGSLVPVETVARLAKRPNVVGLKDSTGSLDEVKRARKLCGDTVAIYSGDDSRTIDIMQAGGKGLISVASNIAPKQMGELVAAAQKKDWALARIIHRQLEPLMGALFLETNPIPAVAAAAMMGYCQNELRLPMTPMSPGPRRKLRRVLQEMRLID